MPVSWNNPTVGGSSGSWGNELNAILTQIRNALNDGTPGTLPGVPTSVVATAGNAKASVAFTAPDPGTSPIISYTVTASTGKSAIGTSSPITVTGLTNGAAVSFTVTATTAAGTGPASAPSNTVTPAGVTAWSGPPAYVQSLGQATLAGSGTTATITTTAHSTVANTILVGVVCNGDINGGAGIPTVTDTAGNTYELSGATSVGTATAVYLFAALNILAMNSGSFITVTFASARTRIAARAHEIGGLKDVNTDPGDGASSGTGLAATTLATAAIQPTIDQDFIMTVFGLTSNGDALTFTPGAGWTAGGQVQAAASTSSRELYAQYKVHTAAGSVASGAFTAASDGITGGAVRTVNVTNTATLQSAITGAVDGDAIVLASGTYSATGQMTLSSKDNITIRAATVGAATISGASNLQLTSCTNVIIDGITFSNCSNATTIKLTDSPDVRISRCVFDAPSLTAAGDRDWVYITGTSDRCHITRNTFMNKFDDSGSMVLVDGIRSTTPQTVVKDLWVDLNWFKDLGPRETNEFETIRYGWSGMARSTARGPRARGIVERNLFERCDGDPEVLSIKCCDVTVRFNTFRDNYGTCIVQRHGTGATIHGNWIFGSSTAGREGGGIRVYDADHKIYNNYLDNLQGDSFESALSIDGGDADTGNSDETSHFRVYRCQCVHNTLVNCATGIVEGEHYTLAVADSRIADNLVVKSTTGAAFERVKTSSNTVYAGNRAHVTGSATLTSGVSSGVTAGNPSMAAGTGGMQRPATAFAASQFYSYLGFDADGETRATGGTTPDVGADEIPTVSTPLLPAAAGNSGNPAGPSTANTTGTFTAGATSVGTVQSTATVSAAKDYAGVTFAYTPADAGTATPAPAAPAYVQALGSGLTTTSSTTTVITTTEAATAGNAIAVAVGANGAQPATVADSAGNTYALEQSGASGTQVTAYIYSARNITALPAGGTITVTYATARSLASAQAHELAGITTTGNDGTATGAGASGTPATTALVTTQANDLVLAAFATVSNGSTLTFTAGSGWSAAGSTQAASGTSSRELFTEQRTVTAAGTSVTATGSLSSSKTWTGVMVAFPAGTTTAPPPSQSGTVTTFSALQAAVTAAAPGDTITLASSTTFGGRLVISGLRGTAANPITITGAATSVLDGGSTGSGYGVGLDQCSYVRLVGFKVQSSKKGIMVDRSDHVTIDGVTVTNIGEEGIHLRNETVDCLVQNCTISNTGLVTAGFGEALYCGTAISNWDASTRLPAAASGYPDRCDRNRFLSNTISNCTAECIDVKEGTHNGLFQGNTMNGSLIQGANFADSWVDVKGGGWTFKANTGTTIMTDGYQTHQLSSIPAQWRTTYTDWNGVVQPGILLGSNNIFDDNTSTQGSSTGYGFNIDKSDTSNRVYTNNTVTGAAAGTSNIPTTAAP